MTSHASTTSASKSRRAAIGEEMLASRVSLMVGSRAASTALVKASWTDDQQLSTHLHRRVAHFTGQAQLAQAIDDGLAARKRGDEMFATERFGCAVRLATENGNEATLQLLRQVVDIDDATTGTVRLKPDVDAADEMALDTRSVKTVPVRGMADTGRRVERGACPASRSSPKRAST